MTSPDRPPPQELTVERTVLGSCLVDNNCLDMVRRECEPSDFYATDHQQVFIGLCKYPTINGSKIDPGRLADIIGTDDAPVLIADLAETIATLANVRDYYIPKLKDAEARRAAIELHNREIDRAYNLETPFTDAANTWKWEVAKLSPKRFFDCSPQEYQFIISRLLAAGIVGFIYGEGGSYKSLAALWLVIIRACIHINNFLLWLGRFEVTPGKSIFFSAEDVEIDLHHRTPAILEVIHHLRPEIPLSAYQDALSENCLIVSREQWTDDGELFLIDENGEKTAKYYRVVSLIKEFGADLVIFETLSRIANIDENDNRAAARVVGVLEMLRDDTGATILCVAHTSKINRGGKTDTHGQNGMRGGGAFMDNARFGLWFRSLPKADGKDRLEIVNSKTFRTQRADPFKVRINFPLFEIDDSETDESIFNAVVEYVRQHPGASTRDIRSNVQGKTTAISQAIKDGKEEEILIFKGKGKGFYVED